VTPAEILRAAPDPSFWRRHVPSLHIDQAEPVNWSAASPGDHAREQLWREGWVDLPRVVPPESVGRLAAGIQCLHDADIPTPFIFVFDEPWKIAMALSPALGALLSAETRVLPDVWAWFVPATAGAHGWAPHRGVTVDVRNEHGAPGLVNVWVALSDVTESSACIHVVPLPQDEHYPDALDRIDVHPGTEVALPISAGGVLVWNANVLHSGGAMKAGAAARLSLSFSFASGGHEPLGSVPPPFATRVDLVADMVVTYCDVAGLEGPWLEWARLWRGMRELRQR
jgi:hypothetical protein